jgi:hypothetical protein
MADDPTEEMVKKEISEAVRILREDGIHISKTISGLFEKFQGKPADPPAPEPGAGDPPPPKPEPGEPVKKSGIWWGNRND